jgi:hypothetical protein
MAMNADDWKVTPLADEFVAVYESPDARRICAYSPGLALLAGGRLVATLDLGGPGVAEMSGEKYRGHGGQWLGNVYTSDDRGRTWTHRADFPLIHARPFAAGGAVYILGHADDLKVMRSDDGGETWSDCVPLTGGERALNPHDVNLITFHTVRNFRRLVY